jgi:hypothetical protein
MVPAHFHGAAAGPLVFPPAPAGNGLLPQQALAQAAIGAPAHLQAFGLPSQVASAAHIHNMVNHFGGSGPASFSFFDGMSSGLAPPIPGQDGPTLEQLLTRNLKNWKPFTSDADFKEALDDWLDRVAQLLSSAQPGGESAAQLKATLSYISTTLGYLNQFGHRVVFQYHKEVTRAMRKVPPLYDPVNHGSAYLQAYVMHLQPAVSATAANSKRTYQSSSLTGRVGRRQSATNPRATQAAAKRNRAEQPCEEHPGSSHTNGECNAQQAKRRARQSAGSASGGT